LAGETDILGENLPQCHFVHHKPNVLYPDANPGRRGGKPMTNRLSYGTAYFLGTLLVLEFSGKVTMVPITMAAWSKA
jgi:hypothetical protein